MRLVSVSIIVFTSFSILTPAFAIESPRVVPRMDEIHKPVGEVFATLKKYFTDSSMSTFQLVSADERTHTLVARQTIVDDVTWRSWAFCQAGPVEMIYKLQDGAVTVTVKLEKTTARSTLASVSADFQGRYALGADQYKADCTSKFVLEDRILAGAGTAPAK
ncbi:MAG TPA: hypothetical protein VIW95_05560 [Candidatus Binatus sp.]|uniref:hypothetical protein n=1 Tax=Candidatus Binatus sp. TaxID=2811406 RepID=UPI002F42F96F